MVNVLTSTKAEIPDFYSLGKTAVSPKPKIPRTCSSVADWLRISSGSYAAGGIYHGRPLVHMLIGLIGSIPSD
ncbi:hypothetical protein Tco_0019075 [Tanacetum coccineum]